MLIVIMTLLAGGAIAFANGANDNGKGVATLIGGNILPPRRALTLAHVATFAGALVALMVGGGLIKVFSGKGLIPDEVLQAGGVMSVVAAGAAVTVLLATWWRLPISTTHALTGALVGASLGRTGTVAWPALAQKFVIPLLFSPFLSAAVAFVLYSLLHRLRLRLGVTTETCICVGPSPARALAGAPAGRSGGVQVLDDTSEGVSMAVNNEVICRQRYRGRVMGVSAAALLDGCHVASASLVSAARGMNDTPKLAAILMGATVAWAAGPAIAVVAVVMGLGGLLLAGRVTATMSGDITRMNEGSAATANAVAAALVLLATGVAMPVSTTHVTCGALFGIGLASRQAEWRMIGVILVAWVTTLPLAAAVAWGLTGLW